MNVEKSNFKKLSYTNRILFFVGVISVILLPVYAHAQWNNSVSQVIGASGFDSSISSQIGTVIGIAIAISGSIFLLLAVYAGILWMTAAGNEEQAGKGQKILTAAIIGMVIIFSAYAITYFVTTRLTPASSGPQKTCAQQGGSCIQENFGAHCTDTGARYQVTKDCQNCCVFNFWQ